VALERPEHREAARQRFLADVQGLVEGADEVGFDVDEVADEALDVPDFPEPGLTLLDLDSALNVPDVLPPGTEMARLDPGSYKLRLPGGEAWVRVTTDADVFDEHAESHEFLSPGGAFFESLATPKSEDSSVPREGLGHCWLVEQGGDAIGVRGSPEGPTPVRSLADLLEYLGSLLRTDKIVRQVRSPKPNWH
jgi:hypothetical protein